MAINEYDRFDALALGELVRSGEVSARELVLEAISRAEALNPTINAIVTELYGAAVEAAPEVSRREGPLAGVPFLLKDLAYQEGVRCTFGSRLFRDFVPDHDADLVKRHRAAGLVIFGRTNTPEVGLAATTEGVLLGPCRNPWNTERTPGGSSGGAAAAVAAGILPAAHATDGGGSIRIPASCCGLVGLKPSRARNPVGPDAGEGWGSMSTGHVVTRSVRDSAAFLDATHGPAPGDPYYAPPFEGSYLEAHVAEPGQLRIAMDLNTITGEAVDPACAEAAKKAAALCESLGHVVEEAWPEYDRATFGQSTGAIVAANVANSIYSRAEALGRELTLDDVERLTLATAERGRAIPASAYVRAIGVIHQTGRILAEFCERYDVILTPTLVSPPVPIGWLNPDMEDLAVYGERFGKFWGFTNLHNATGQPAISLPLHWTDDGLPVGVQLAAGYGNELLLLQIARQLEEAAPWFDKRP
jgi:amidase